MFSILIRRIPLQVGYGYDTPIKFVLDEGLNLWFFIEQICSINILKSSVVHEAIHKNRTMYRTERIDDEYDCFISVSGIKHIKTALEILYCPVLDWIIEESEKLQELFRQIRLSQDISQPKVMLTQEQKRTLAELMNIEPDILWS